MIMLPILMSAATAFSLFSENVKQAKANMNITDQVTISATTEDRKDVRGRRAYAWTARQQFSTPALEWGFRVTITERALRTAGKGWLQWAAYHEMCHMLSDRDALLAGRLPTKAESDINEKRANRCADNWMKTIRKGHKKSAWAKIGLVLIMLP